MNLQQLQYFQTVARLQHFTKAAKEHNTSQPALSCAISNLENELSVKLFEKKGRGVALSKYGEVLLKYIDSSLEELNKGIEELSFMRQFDNSTITLYTSQNLRTDVLPSILKELKKINFDYIIKIDQGTNRDLLELLEAGKIDFVLTNLESFSTDNPNFFHKVLFYENLYLLTSHKNPLSNYDEITFNELINEKFILFDKNNTIKKNTLNFFKKNKFEPNISYEIKDNKTLESLIEANLGVTIVNQVNAVNKNKIRAIKFNSNIYKSQICLIWNKNEKSLDAVKNFKNFILNNFPEPLYLE